MEKQFKKTITNIDKIIIELQSINDFDPREAKEIIERATDEMSFLINSVGAKSYCEELIIESIIKCSTLKIFHWVNEKQEAYLDLTSWVGNILESVLEYSPDNSIFLLNEFLGLIEKEI